MHRMKPQQGLTLIELMIAVTAGLVVLLAAMSILTSTLSSNTSGLRYTRLNQDFRGVMNMITHDLARAGYWGMAAQIVDTSSQTDLQFSGTTGAVTATSYQRGGQVLNNAFAAPYSSSILVGRTLVLLMPNTTAPGSPLQRYNLSITALTDANNLAVTIPTGVTLPSTLARAASWTVLNPFTTITQSAANDCIVFAYDLDKNGVLGANESFGYRLDATGVLQVTTSGAPCTGGAGWQNVTDETTMQVSSFSVTQRATTSAAADLLNGTVQEYAIQMTGQLRSDANAVRVLQETVKVRNDTFN